MSINYQFRDSNVHVCFWRTITIEAFYRHYNYNKHNSFSIDYRLYKEEEEKKKWCGFISSTYKELDPFGFYFLVKNSTFSSDTIDIMDLRSANDLKINLSEFVNLKYLYD